VREGEELTARHWVWILKHWPRVIIWVGTALFWLACIYAESLPVEFLFVGPGLMLAGVVMMKRNEREMRDTSDVTLKSYQTNRKPNS
jgi:hypothetical protein